MEQRETLSQALKLIRRPFVQITWIDAKCVGNYHSDHQWHLAATIGRIERDGTFIESRFFDEITWFPPTFHQQVRNKAAPDFEIHRGDLRKDIQFYVILPYTVGLDDQKRICSYLM